MSMPVKDDAVIHNRLGHVMGQSMGVFYAENGIIGLRNLE